MPVRYVFTHQAVLFLSPVNIARKGHVCLSHVLKDISKHFVFVFSTSLSKMYERSKKKVEQNPTKDEIKAKTVY